MCEVKLSDINKIYFFNDRVIIKIIARVTRANQDWNQEFNLEGILSEKSIMNFVYWLNEFLKEEHNLDLNNFGNWEINETLYLWGHNSSQSRFIKPISYETVYKTWRKFYTNAGIDDKLMGTHSFRSGFYCQSILNSNLKMLSTDVMKELSELLAGWKNKSDAKVYRKPQMTALTTWLGYITNPSPEQMLGSTEPFISKW